MEEEYGVWYRFIDPWTVGEKPYRITIPVKRWTTKCVVLNDYGKERFILKNARKRYAYPTEALALDSYIIRKQRQIQHAAATHDNARENLAAAEAMQRGDAPAVLSPKFEPWEGSMI
jgi:hypothetical protein